MKNVEEQLEIIRRGTTEIISEEELREKLAQGRPLRVKYGADPSAPDLHIGHAIPLRKLRDFQELGHIVVFVIGDFTGRIGDPSGMGETRGELTKETVEGFAKTYHDQVGRILDTGKMEMRYNAQWFDQMSFTDAVKLCSFKTVARMLERDDFRERFKKEAPIGIHEFMYPLIQGYDSVAVEADVEIGGTDQKFNLLEGRLVQRHFGQPEQVVITLPLLEGIDGVRKMSKSYGNAIGIAEPPGEKFGKAMAIPDSLIIRYFQLATRVPLDEIREMERAMEAGENPRDVKRRLAREIVALYDGQEAIADAEEDFKYARYGYAEITVATGIRASGHATFTKVVPRFEKPPRLIDLLVEHLKAATSLSRARQLVRQEAVKLDGVIASDETAPVEVRDGLEVRVGHRVWILKIEDEGQPSGPSQD